MNQNDIERRIADANPDKPIACTVSEIMLEVVKNDNFTTLAELGSNLRDTISHLKKTKNGVILSCVGELFFRHITLNSANDSLIEYCRKDMITRGQGFLEGIRTSRQKIAKLCHPFVTDGYTVLTHSYSRVVFEVLKTAAEDHKHFQVLVTESKPDSSGRKMKATLDKRGIPCTMILDAEVGHVMEKVDVVLVGAESVVESGGIINKIGTYQMAICARELNKPFYVLAESFKFARLYPLNQQDMRNQLEEGKGEPTTRDYTPPAYITLLFTELGILTPSAVSDELIKIYT